MCGISGIYNLKSTMVSESKIHHFTRSMTHRGPDGEGYVWLDNRSLVLGHRRLATLDLSEAGKQPMSYANQRYWICYNGEIYNFSEIRSELEQKGHHFLSQSDTEVLLAAYAEWGKDCLKKFNGDWAFAIWDDEKKELFLSRDRFGVKPLYYLYQDNRRFVFASETRAFKFLEGFKREIDDKLLEMTLNDPYALEGLGYTIFKDIYQVLPGHYLVVKKGEPIQQKRWWDIEEHLQKDISNTLEEQAQKFYTLFEDACRLRLVSDVPVATALSGGLDSSSVYAVVSDLLQKEHPDRTHHDSNRAFTAVFPGLPQDEQEYAQKASAFCGGKIETIETETKTLWKSIKHETELADFISSSPITSVAAVYAGMKKKGITVSMDGHGVDEMLYGYRDMVYALYNDALWNGTETQVADYAQVLQNMYHPDVQSEQKVKFERALADKIKREAGLTFRLKKLLNKKSKDNMEFVPVRLPSLSDSAYDFSQKPLPERMVYNQFFQHTLPALLRNFDRASMMNGIEIRMPFMDWRLVCYVFSLPLTAKIGLGFTKLLLREAMKGKLDEEIRTRTFKVGISSPLEHWFNGVLKDDVINAFKQKSVKQEVLEAYKQGKLSTALVRKVWLKLNVEAIGGSL